MPRYMVEELGEGQTEILCLYNNFIGVDQDLLHVFDYSQCFYVHTSPYI